MPNFIAIGLTLRPAAHPQNCDTYIHTHTHIYIYKLLNRGWFWGLGAMTRETMMKISGSRTMIVNAIGIFLRNLPKNIMQMFTQVEW